ncbi:MAG: DNA polymerase IV [Gammaproteobacteria bacterium]|nr:DNA polymerase IV [Gammaproteobacteria bacterium]
MVLHPLSTRRIIHIDMDAFYASVEIRERPELAARPVVVGGRADGRGVVAAANYIARRFGIHSAMPTATALRLCPRLVVLPPRHGVYAGVSRQLHAIFGRYTPQIEPLALDEAFLDITASERLFGSAEQIARAIKQAIRDELALVASVGVAPNKFLAKLAGDVDKPDGFVVVTEEGVERFLAPLPVSRIWGVGKVAAQGFERLGIRTIGQLRHYPPQLIREHFGNSGEQFLRLAQGLDERPVVSEQEAKSISNETTFTADISNRRVLRDWLHALTEQVAWRLRAQQLKGRTVHLKVRLADFTTLTRSHSLESVTDTTAEIWQVVQTLFEQRLMHPLPAVRLLGVGISNFSPPPPRQGDLFAAVDEGRQRRIDTVLDEMKARFGQGVIRRGKAPPAE